MIVLFFFSFRINKESHIRINSQKYSRVTVSNLQVSRQKFEIR